MVGVRQWWKIADYGSEVALRVVNRKWGKGRERIGTDGSVELSPVYVYVWSFHFNDWWAEIRWKKGQQDWALAVLQWVVTGNQLLGSDLRHFSMDFAVSGDVKMVGWCIPAKIHQKIISPLIFSFTIEIFGFSSLISLFSLLYLYFHTVFSLSSFYLASLFSPFYHCASHYL